MDSLGALGETIQKRAIVWLAWGERYISEAIRSRDTVKDLGYPTVLVTDRTSLAADVNVDGFDRVIAAPFERSASGNQRKSELWGLIPKEYDSFLFLDTDTRVLGDISLGFEKAERFGIAMVPAAHYCLDYFWGFDDVMRKEGIAPRGQLQYNSGVIFWSRTPDVEAVFNAWNALTMSHGGRWDQCFLSLAMEKLNFRPYALSPNYNYRGMGVPIIGDIRIWHTPHEPPANINSHPEWWPMRYFVDGKLHHPHLVLRTIKVYAMRLAVATLRKSRVM